MSIFLITVLILLLAGAFITSLLSDRQGKWAITGATVVLAIILVVWILANRNLPLSLVLVDWSSVDSTSPWLLLVDEINWQISFYFLLLMEALLLTQARFNLVEPTPQSFSEQLFLPLTLVATAVVLVAVWSSSLIGLISSWTLLATIWLVLLWLDQGAKADPKDLIRRFGLLLLSVAFLGLTVATSDRPAELALTAESWPPTSLFLAYLAVFTQLGAIPLQWWRPLTSPLSPLVSGVVHLLPGVAGTALLARLVLFAGSQTAIAAIFTLLGWLGLFFGAYLAWMHMKRPVLAVTGLAVAQVGLMGIVGGWADSNAVVASYRVLILAIGGLYLINGLPKQHFPWYIVVPVAALAGLPLTVGFLGLAPLYSGWLSSDRLVLTVVTGLLMIPVIAAALQLTQQATIESREETLPLGERIQLNLGLLLPSLGLLVVPGPNLVDVPLTTWLLIVSMAGASIIFSRYGEQLSLRLLQVTQGLKRGDIGDSVGRNLAKLSHGLNFVIRESARILEGEAGLLWLLVLVVIIWLARSG
jgi:hypothetical protein